MGTRSAAAVAAPVSDPKAEQPQVQAPTITTFDMGEAKFIQPSALGDEGKAYIEKLTKILGNEAPQIRVDALPHRIESVAVLEPALHKAIILVFNESYTPTQTNLPPTEYMPEIVERCFRKRHEGFQVLEYIIVSKDDYARVEKMAVFIINAFRSITPGVALTAESFRKMRLVPCTDLKQVTAFIDRYSPHAVQDRADWGVMVNRVIGTYNNDAYMNIREPDMHTIMAATGYTKFVNIGNDIAPRFLPIAVITNVTATVPSTDILPIILPIVAGAIISQKVWQRPYTTWADNKPNLGRLLVDPNKKALKFFKNPQEMAVELAGKLIEVPYLALDCAEGRARIPYLERLFMPQDPSSPVKTSYISDLIGRFFGPAVAASADVMAVNQNPIICTFLNYEGVFTTGGQKLDTRSADYLNTVTATKDFERSRCMLAQCMVASQHINDVVNIYGEDGVTPLYRIHTLVFNSALINLFASLVSGVVDYVAEYAVNQNYDFAALLSQYGVAIGGAYSLYGAGGAGFNSGAGVSLYQ